MTRGWHILIVVVLTIVAVGCRRAPAAPVAALGSPAAGGAQVQPKPMPAEFPTILATVNGENVERWELENALRGVEAVHGGTPMPPEQRDGILRGLLDQIIAYHLIGQEAQSRKLAPGDEEVNGKVAEMRRQYPDDAAFQSALAKMGVTLDQVQRQTRLGLAVERMIDAEVTSKIAIGDAEIESFYQQNIERFKQGEAAHASHILRAVAGGADPAARQKAREEAQRILEQLRKGAEFATLAREQSQDSSTAAAGGDLGFVPRGQTDAAFEAAIFALKPGALSDVVESTIGFHIIKLHERRGPRTEPFAEVSGQIKEFLGGQQHAAKLGEFVDRVKAKSKIEIFV
jgi:peptidyl-prolyl cis-trans isomerase C